MNNCIVSQMQKLLEDKTLAPPLGEGAGMQHFSSRRKTNKNSLNPVQSMLGRAHVSALCLHTTPDMTVKILRESGKIAGENYAYSHMDFEKGFLHLASDLSKVCENTGLPYWETAECDEKAGEILLCLDPWKGCYGQKQSTSSHLCEYMQGLAVGIFTAYTGREYTLHSQCRHFPENKHSPSLCYYRLVPFSSKHL